MRKYSRLSWLLLCVLMLCISGCGGSGGSAADPMGTATVQFIDETGAVLYPEEGGGLFGFLIDPGESRQLIVKVTNARSDGSSVPVVREKVTFTLLTPQNGGHVTMVKEYTDSSGRAVGMYTAGNNFDIDNIRATTDAGASAECSVYKTGGLVGSQIASLATDGEPSTADGSYSVSDGQTRIVTATITDGVGNPRQGVAVTFTLATNDSGGCFIDSSSACVSSVVAYSDISGTAQVTYRAGSQWSTEEHFDTVRATLSNGSTRSIVFRRSAETGLSISVSANPSSVTAGNISIITATVTGEGNAGVTVSFSRTINNSGATLSAYSATTDGNGQATVIYTAGSNSSTTDVSDTITAAVGSVSGSVVITRSASSGSEYSITVTAAPATLATNTSSSIVTATVEDSDGAVVGGVTVNFTVSGTAPLGTLSVASGVTLASGNVVTTFTGGGGGTHTNVVTATIDGTAYNNAVIITYP